MSRLDEIRARYGSTATPATPATQSPKVAKVAGVADELPAQNKPPVRRHRGGMGGSVRPFHGVDALLHRACWNTAHSIEQARDLLVHDLDELAAGELSIEQARHFLRNKEIH